MQHSKHVASITYFSHLILYGKIMFVVGSTRNKEYGVGAKCRVFCTENNGTCSYGHYEGLRDL
jgi:hypothetical protein